MSQIKVLDKHVAELIAAGEVVERPASVIKELVENSIDAGAVQVTVEIQNGGISYMRVTDNGSGISRSDVPTAFLRHATSKVASASDLDTIGTLGFRGEALASIAAVARVEMMTCCDGETGVRYAIHGGEEVSFDDAGCPVGTTIIVRDLFYNTPARMKFMKKDVSESNAVAGVLDKIALSHPEVSIRFIRDGKNTLSTPGNGDLKATVYAVFGRDFTNSLISVDYSFNGMSVSGFVGSPVTARANRNMQHFYINGRCVKSKNMIAALEQACKNSVMIGKFPSCVLNLTIPYNMVDINVSPSKTEARFADERAVFNIIYYGVKTALAEGDTRPQLKLDRTVQNAVHGEQMSLKNTESRIKSDTEPATIGKNKHFADETVALQSNEYVITSETSADSQRVYEPRMKYSTDRAESYEQYFMRSEPVIQYQTGKSRAKIDVICDDEPENEPNVIKPISHNIQDTTVTHTMYESPSAEDSQSISDNAFVAGNTVSDKSNQQNVDYSDADCTTGCEIRVIGEVFTTYIMAEYGDSIVFIDKHAAHERILFEKIKCDQHDSQILLEPVTVSLAKDEYALMLENLDIVSRVGFEIEDFGASSVIVRAVPTVLVGENIKELVLEIAGGFTDNKTTIEIEKLDWLYHNIACRAAIKAGSRSNATEMAALAERIIKHDDIKYCPHGRPVAFILTKKELEKQFGRLQ